MFFALYLLVTTAIVVLIIKTMLDSGRMPGKKSQRQMVRTIDPKTAYEYLQSDLHGFGLIDVRVSREYLRNHIKGALNLNVMDLKFVKGLAKFKKNGKYIIYGQGNTRSQRAFDIMKKMGFQEVYMMSGGLLEWELLDYPVEKSSNATI